MSVEQWQVPLWDAINRYVSACGGDPNKHVYGNTMRQKAVAEVNKIVRIGSCCECGLSMREHDTGLAWSERHCPTFRTHP